MFSNKARALVLAVFALMTGLFVWKAIWELAAFSLLMIVLVIVEYFKQGTLVLAAKHYHDRDYAGAEELLRQIRRPDWLLDKRRGIYEYMLGNICLQRQDYEQAVVHYDLASRYPLRSINDHVAALVHAANISIRLGQREQAASYLQQASHHERETTAKMNVVIAKLKEELKNN